MITHAYPLVSPLKLVDGIRLASIEDIAAMKLNAIVGNGTRLKDFVDVAFMSCYLPLKTMLDAYEQKYSSRNPVMILKALAYHLDINFQEPIQVVNGNYSWMFIEKRLAKMLASPLKVFNKLPAS